MKVLMFGWEFPPHISGGLGTACYGLTKAMSKIPDIDILFVVPKAYGDEDSSAANVIGAGDVNIDQQVLKLRGFQKEINFIKVDSTLIPYVTEEEYFRIMSRLQKNVEAYTATNFKGKLHFTGKYGANLYEEINNYAMVAAMIAVQNEFDVIHAHDWLTYPAGIAAKQISGKPLVIHVHATDFDRSGGNVNPYVYEVEKNGMMMADKIITVSNLTRNIVIKKYGIDPAKVVTVHNAVEPVFRENEEHYKPYCDKVVTFLGRITLQKGPDYFIEAARKVLKRMNNVRFVMAGSGDMLNRMVSHVARAGISHRFHFTGFLSGDDVYKMYEMSDVYVMPSISEPFGIAPLEAMQSNVPVIISRQSGVAEVLNYAIKVDFWDIDAMADAIYGLLNYEALPVMFKKYGRMEVQSLQWEKSASRIHQVYREVLNK
jgi:glycosyltransferase involved in cell wall biosynthesis